MYCSVVYVRHAVSNSKNSRFSVEHQLSHPPTAQLYKNISIKPRDNSLDKGESRTVRCGKIWGCVSMRFCRHHMSGSSLVRSVCWTIFCCTRQIYILSVYKTYPYVCRRMRLGALLTCDRSNLSVGRCNCHWTERSVGRVKWPKKRILH